MTLKPPIRILLVDDQATVRHGLRLRLGLERDLEVVGEADSGRTAVPLACSTAADVVLMDVQMADGDGIAATEALSERSPRTAIVVLSLYDDAATTARATAAGAAAFVPKHASEALLVPTIRRVAGR